MSAAVAIDLGSAITRVADSEGRVLFEEPTLAAVERSSGRLLAIGEEAADLARSSAGRIALERPVRAGKLVDVELADAVVAELFSRVGLSRFARAKVAMCAHVGASNVQQRALERALRHAGASEIRFIEQPVAVALGAGLRIGEPSGTMVVDVGAGTSDIGVMALGGLVTCGGVAVGANDLDDAARLLLARAHGVALDRERVTELRQRVGSLCPDPLDAAIEVVGRDTLSGRPKSANLGLGELARGFRRIVEPIFTAAVRCVTSAPPDLANDLLGSGLVLAGGGSLLAGFDRGLATATGVPVHVLDDRDQLAVRGAAICLDDAALPAPVLSSRTAG